MTIPFSVNGSDAVLAPEHDLVELGLREWNHLQEWVIENPQPLGDDVMIVTADYDRWSSTQGVRARGRLDVLGLEASGRLVVVEIKRGRLRFRRPSMQHRS